MTLSKLIQYYKTVATSILAIQLTIGIRERKRERAIRTNATRRM